MLQAISPEFKLLTALFSEESCFELNKELDWEQFISISKQHRLVSSACIKLKEFRTQIPEAPLMLMQKESKKQKLRMLHFSAEISRLNSTMENRQIPCLFIKGPVAAKQIFDDFTAKESRDIDVLVHENKIEECLHLLFREGYEIVYPYLNLNRPQKKYFKKVNNQLALFHPQKKIQLEVHWRLFANKHLLPYRFEQLYAAKETLQIGGQSVYGLGKNHLFIYLCAHGAKHAWAKLYWLVEVFTLLKKTKDLEPISNEAKKMGVERTIFQALKLIDLFFDSKPSSVHLSKQEDKKTKELISFSLMAIEATNQLNGGKVNLKKEKTYRSKLSNNAQYQSAQKKLLSINDFTFLSIPAYLFFLYYPLRPFLWIGRLVSNPTKKSHYLVTK